MASLGKNPSLQQAWREAKSFLGQKQSAQNYMIALIILTQNSPQNIKMITLLRK